MSSDTENISNKENIENTLQIEEDSTYPLDNKILYRERTNKITKRSFNYTIIKEGVYPNGVGLKSDNKSTSKKNNIKFHMVML